MEIKPKRNAKPAKDATVADAGARVVEALAGAAGDVPPAERGQTVRLLIEGVAVVAAVIAALVFSGVTVRQDGCGQAAGRDITGGTVNCGPAAAPAAMRATSGG